MVLARLLPHDERFFAYFVEAAQNNLLAAQEILDLFDHYEDVERKVRSVRNREHYGDEITHRLYSAVNSTFVTPLDREDIRELASKLDDFVDELEEVARRLRLYKIERPTEPSRQLAHTICKQAEILSKAVALLEKQRNSAQLRQHIIEVNRLEDEADTIFNAALAGLFDGVADIPSLITTIRWREIYDLLEETTDRAEDVANTLEGIQMKYA